MIKKLQYKFVAISGGAALILMGLLLVMINQFFYGIAMNNSYKMLELLSENEGELPDSYKDDVDLDPEDALYRHRHEYFSVWTDSEGKTILNRNLKHSDWVSQEEADKFALEALSHRGKKGVIKEEDNFYMYKVNDRAGDKLIVFLCLDDDLEYIYSLRKLSVLFCLICMVFFLLLVSAMSRRALRPVIRNMENQKQFITNAGHELKTPLAIISANTEVLEMMEGENEWTRSTMKQVERLDLLVKNLITLAKMGEVDAEEITKVDFSSMVESSVTDFQTMAAQKGLQMDKEIESNLMVKGVESHLQELIIILCDNALKYCDEGGSISVLLKKGRLKSLSLEVSNSYQNGENIDCSRLFDRFYREDSSHNSEKAGYGIGLAMAEGFVKECKGKIHAEYKDGRISFCISLPMA